MSLKKPSIAVSAAGAALLALLVSSCSTTRALKDDEIRLNSNSIVITNDTRFPAHSLSAYLKQQPNHSLFGFKPFLYMYNWSGGSDKGLNKLWKSLGEAPVIYDQNQVERSESSIVSRLNALGYFDSTVESELRLKGREADVTYYVTLGRRYIIDSVAFSLPAYRPDFEEDFYADTANVSIHRGEYLSEDMLNAEVSRSVSALREKGYFALDKAAYSFVADTLAGDGRVRLEYIIKEGDQRLTKAKIGNVNITFPENLNVRESVLKGVNLIRPGDTYSESGVSYTYLRFSSLKIFNTVGIDMHQVSDQQVDCDITLTKSKPQGLKTNLEVSTNSSGLIGISPQLNFYHKNIFRGGEWLNLGFVGNFQFMPNEDISSNEFGTSLSLSFPQFLGLGYKFFKGPSIPRTEINASFNYQNRPEYTRNLFSTSFGYSGTIRNRFYYQFYPFRLNYVRLFNLTDDFSERLDKNPFMRYSYQDHCDMGISATFFYNSSADLVPKTDYHSARLAIDMSGNVVSLFNGLLRANGSGEKLLLNTPYSQYARVEAIFAKAIRFGHNDAQSLAVRLLGGVGIAYGNSTSLPYEKQFYCGGASSMRGWQARSLGPGASPMDDTFSIPSQTGDYKLEADVEYRFPLFSKLEGALFTEVGNVWKKEDGITLQDLAADWGLGLRVNLDFLVLRVDLGIKLRDPSVEEYGGWLSPVSAVRNKGAALHFGVGYPF